MKKYKKSLITFLILISAVILFPFFATTDLPYIILLTLFLPFLLALYIHKKKMEAYKRSVIAIAIAIPATAILFALSMVLGFPQGLPILFLALYILDFGWTSVLTVAIYGFIMIYSKKYNHSPSEKRALWICSTVLTIIGLVSLFVAFQGLVVNGNLLNF